MISDTKERAYILGVLFVVSAFNYIDRTILSILQVPIKQDLGLTDTQLGLLTGLSFALFYATLSLPIARCADRMVRKGIIAAALGVWSAMTALTALANSFGTLVLLRIGVAVGEAGSIPASHSMIADLYPSRMRATAMAILGLSLPLGMMLGFVAAGLLAETLGWRMSFAVIGILGLLIVPLVLWTIREPVRGRFDFGPATSATSATSNTSNASDAPHSAPPEANFLHSLRLLWNLRCYRYLVAGAALHAYAYYAVLNWSAPFYVRTHGLSIGEVSTYLALANGLGGSIGMYLGGRMSDRLGLRDAGLRVRVLTFAAVVFVVLALAQYLVPSTAASLAIGAAAFALLPFYYGPVVAVPQLLVAPNMRALTSAVTLLVVNLIGLGLGPAVTGFISDTLVDRYGMVDDSLRYAISAAVLMSLIAAALYWRASNSLVAEMREPAGAPVADDAGADLTAPAKSCAVS